MVSDPNEGVNNDSMRDLIIRVDERVKNYQTMIENGLKDLAREVGELKQESKETHKSLGERLTCVEQDIVTLKQVDATVKGSTAITKWIIATSIAIAAVIVAILL
jgi:hypothetical protein